MSNRIAAFIEEQEKLFDEEHMRALRDRDALLMVIRQFEQSQQQQQQESDKSDDDTAESEAKKQKKQEKHEEKRPAVESDAGIFESPMFSFQEDDEKRTPYQSPAVFEDLVEPSIDEDSEHDEEQQDDGLKEVSLGVSGTVLLPDPEPAPKVPILYAPHHNYRVPSVTNRGIVVPLRRSDPVLLSNGTGIVGSSTEEERDVVYNMYGSSMPIQVPLLEEDSLDLRKRAKRALVMQAYGKAAHPIRSQSATPSAGASAINLDGPDLPLSQSFAVPSSLSLRNPFRPE